MVAAGFDSLPSSLNRKHMYTIVLCRREAHQKARVFKFSTPDPRKAFANYNDWLEREVMAISGRVKVGITTRLSILEGSKVIKQIRLQTIKTNRVQR